MDKHYAIKRRHPDNPKLWEWKTFQVENHTYVDLYKYDTIEEAEAAAAEWDPTAIVSEIRKVD